MHDLVDRAVNAAAGADLDVLRPHHEPHLVASGDGTIPVPAGEEGFAGMVADPDDLPFERVHAAGHQVRFADEIRNEGAARALVDRLGPRNRALLQRREELQAQIDNWHLAHPGNNYDRDAYEAFLRDIGYLLPEGPDFEIRTIYELLDVIERKPGLFIGERSVSALWSFTHGFLCATHAFAIDVAPESPPFHEFHAFVASNVDAVPSGAGWRTLLLEASGGDEARAFDRFYELLRVYRQR